MRLQGRRPAGWEPGTVANVSAVGTGSTTEGFGRRSGHQVVGLDDAERLRLRREAMRELAAGAPLPDVLRRVTARARSLALRHVALAERNRVALAGTIVARAMLPMRRPRSRRSRCRRVAGRRVASSASGESDGPAGRATRPHRTAGGCR